MTMDFNRLRNKLHEIGKKHNISCVEVIPYQDGHRVYFEKDGRRSTCVLTADDRTDINKVWDKLAKTMALLMPPRNLPN